MAKKEEDRYYTAQRNYEYECEHPDGKYYGLSEEQWKDQIRKEWSCKNLNADHVVLIFHDKDTEVDDHGNETLKPLHVHACIKFHDTITPSAALKRTKCSRESNCKMMGDKAQAYRYLLHITEKALSEHKYIYEYKALEIEVVKGKFDYYKEIFKSAEKQETVDEKKLLRKVIKDIATGKYDECLIVEHDGRKGARKSNLRDTLLSDERIGEMMCMKSSHDREIDHAMDIRCEVLGKQLKSHR